MQSPLSKSRPHDGADGWRRIVDHGELSSEGPAALPPGTRIRVERLFALVDFVLPRARAEGKSHLTFAVGCTGGRHRSVYVARRLARHLVAAGEPEPVVEERDLPK